MNNFTLTMIDSSGIQDYIFGSNRLQENIGASELVYQATTSWVFNALDKCEFRHNVNDGQPWNWKKNDNQRIEKDKNPDAEVVYAGGGNTLIIFRDNNQDKARAIKFTRKLTRRILEDAPGLTVAVQHVDFNMQQDKLPDKRKELLKKLAKHKQARLPLKLVSI